MPEPLTDARWFLVAGATLVLMALASSVLRRLPLTASVLYLALGAAIGPLGLGLARIDPIAHAPLLELLTELAVILSLFTAGLKLREPLRAGRWRLPARLALLSMILTVALIAVAGYVGLGLSVGAAILLGAILAPTDPVLASDVQVTRPTDLEDLRFGLTGEAGLNDGTAFPIVWLGLGLLGLHELGGGARWLLVDVAWASAGGLVIGLVAGTLVGRFVLYVRRTHQQAVGLDEFLGLGLIALSYGIAVLAGTLGFLAVFAAGLAVRRIELNTTGIEPDDPQVVEAPRHTGGDPLELATHPEHAPAYMASALLEFNEQLERIAEIALVVVIGAMLAVVPIPVEAIWFVPLLFLVIRPVSVALGLAGSGTPRTRLAFLGWFGIRGIGSLYYLMYAIVHGLPTDLAMRLTGLVLTVVALSIVIHGVSVTPLMERYEERRKRRTVRHA